MKILVTGGKGFIAQNLIKRIKPNNEIYCLSHTLTTSSLNNNNIKYIFHDFNKHIDNISLPQNLDVIIHLAQSKFYRKFPDKSMDLFNVNIKSTAELLEYGRKIGIKKFIYASSGGIYGYSYEKFIESDYIVPINYYLSTKYCSELLIANYRNYFSTIVLRFFFVYGSGQRGMLIPNLVTSIKEGKPIIIYGKEGISINPINVKDAVAAIEASINYPDSEIFNVCGDEVISIKSLSSLIGDILNKKPIFSYEKFENPGDIVGDNSKMKTLLGIKPEINLKDGLIEMIKDF